MFYPKGAFGEKEYVPDIQRHLQNQLSWLEVNIMDWIIDAQMS